MIARRKPGTLLCRIPIAHLAIAAGAGIVVTISTLAEGQRALSIGVGAGALVALALGAAQIMMCIQNSPTAPHHGPATDRAQEDSERG